MENSTFIELIRSAVYLTLFEVYFVKDDSLTNDDLKEFKQQVLRLVDEMQIEHDVQFKVRIHTKRGNSVVKYFYQRNSLMNNPAIKDCQSELDMMFSMIEYRNKAA